MRSGSRDQTFEGIQARRLRASGERALIGRAVIPAPGEQVIVSILYNHDANPVHHRLDHAIQWMLTTGGEGRRERRPLAADGGANTAGTRLLALKWS
jgi:hypothetical protein